MRNFFVCFHLVCVLPVFADETEARTPGKAVEVLSFFVGSCWHGTFSDGQSKDVHCFTPVYNQFVRDTHEVSGELGPYGGETIYRWNNASRQLEYTYWDTTGGVSEGVLIPTDDGFVSPEEAYQNAAGETLKMRTRWRLGGPDQWTQLSETLPDTSRRTLWEITYHRGKE